LWWIAVNAKQVDKIPQMAVATWIFVVGSAWVSEVKRGDDVIGEPRDPFESRPQPV
jgi:hypothetical protein